MLTANLNTVELRDSKSPTDDSLQVRVTFPVTAFQGAADSAVVYFEVEPGKRLGRHTDSQEEILYILAGQGDAEVNDEWASVVDGTLVVVPAQAPHQIRNTGTSTLKVLGFFAGSSIVSIFEESLFPGTDQVVFVNGPNGMEIFNASRFVPGAPSGVAEPELTVVA